MTEGLEYALAGYRDSAYPLELLNTAMVVVYLAISLVSLRRWPMSYALYAWGSILVALLLPADGHPV